MKNTQAHKLSLVLKNGTLRQVKIEELTSSNCYSFDEIQSYTLKGFSCWEFCPYNTDSYLEKTWQFSPNPFTLVDMIYKILSA